MNRSDIEWTHFTSNPVRGKCLHACSFCYAERIRQRFGQPIELSWHPEELDAIERRKKPSVIFMGSMHDLFGYWVPNEWIESTINTAMNCPQHTFLFLTKNPGRYFDFEFPSNCWTGTTVIKTEHEFEVKTIVGERTFVSVEPLVEPVSLWRPMPLLGAVIIGAMTGPHRIVPQKEWVESIIAEAKDCDVPVFLKDNLLQIFPDLHRFRETAWKL
jgi:protein gp37